MAYYRRPSLRAAYYSDDGLARQPARSSVHKGTQSDPQSTRLSATQEGDDTSMASPGVQSDQMPRPPPRKSYSLNSFKPQVTLIIHLLQAVAVVLGFFNKLFTEVYTRLFTRAHMAQTNSASQCTASDQACLNLFANSVYSRPHLPTERTIAAQTLWNYMKMNQPLIESDVILLLGNYDVRTSQHACQLWHNGWAEYIMYTCIADTKKGREEQSLAFERAAEAMQVPLEHVLLENNSGDITAAIPNSYKMLASLKLALNSLIVIHLPFMERLVQLTFQHLWPDTTTNVTVTSPLTTMIAFPNATVGNMEQVVEDIAEAVEFILQFDTNSKFAMPDEVLEAFRTLRPSMADALITKKPDKESSTHIRKPPEPSNSQRSSTVSTYTGPITRSATNSLPNVKLPTNKPILFADAKTIRLKFSKVMDR